MYCPFCRHSDSRVVDSRTTDDGTAIRRRRQCPEDDRHREPEAEEPRRKGDVLPELRHVDPRGRRPGRHVEGALR